MNTGSKIRWTLLAAALLLVLAVTVFSVSQAVRAASGVPLPTVIGPLPVTDTSYPFGAADHTMVPEDLSKVGYVEEEYLVSGTANVYTWPAPGPAVVRTANAPYTTRMLVRRPAQRGHFSGNVIVGGSGYCADVTVSTASTGKITWSVPFTYSGTLQNIWSAKLATVGGVLRASGESWNATVSAAAPVTFGYCANGKAPTPTPTPTPTPDAHAHATPDARRPRHADAHAHAHAHAHGDANADAYPVRHGNTCAGWAAPGRLLHLVGGV